MSVHRCLSSFVPTIIRTQAPAASIPTRSSKTTFQRLFFSNKMDFTNANFPFQILLDRNKEFSKTFHTNDPARLAYLSSGQTPHTLWLGCSDSRVSESLKTQSAPGEIFTHRNIANIISSKGDPSSAAVISYGVRHLRVQHVVVCGHTGCGGAERALKGTSRLDEGLQHWLKPITELCECHAAELKDLANDDERTTRLAELNVKRSLKEVLKHPAVKEALEEKRVSVHGLIYDVSTALLRELDLDT